MNSTPDPTEADCDCFEFVSPGDAILGELPFFPEEFRLLNNNPWNTCYQPPPKKAIDRVFDQMLGNRKNRQ